MTRILLRTLLAAGAVLLAAGCASTSIRSAWFDPDYRGGPFRRIVVVALNAGFAETRVFEDVFAQKLKAAGVEGVPGYRIAGENATNDEAAWAAAVAGAGADGVLTVRLLGVDTRTRVYTTVISGPVLWGAYGSWWGPSMIPVQEVTQYEVAAVETTLWDVATRRVVWAAATETFDPRTVAQETPTFADVIIGELAARGLAPPRK